MAQRLLALLLLLSAATAAADTVFPISTSAELEDLLTNGAGGVPDGGVIELAAGTYAAPAGGFLIFNPGRDFTIRAATAGTVFLDGSGSERIFRFTVNDSAQRGAVVFDGLTFRDGFSTGPAFGSAITLQEADATFIDCVFEDNVNQSAGSGSGTVGLRQGAVALFLRTIWSDNTSETSGAGAVIVGASTFWCHQCQFLRNRNNVPGHIPTASGGGLTATSESAVYLSNSRFEANQTAFSGGAINIKGSFDDASQARLVVTNSTFVDNVARPDPSVMTNSPASGGVTHVEDNAVAAFYNSRFLDNQGQFGGAISAYRSTVEIYDSVFRGNLSTGGDDLPETPRGGTIFANSNDTSADGGNNRPASDVTIRDSLFDGRVTSSRRGPQTAPAHTGGCIYAIGDLNRHLGLNGVPQGGTQTQNSARVDVAGSAFVDCDVDELLASGTLGGGMFTELAIVTVDDSLFAGCDAVGGSGGAVAFRRLTDATVTDSVFAGNSSTGRGGAIVALGAVTDVDGCGFYENTVPGATAAASLGAALYTGFQSGVDEDAGGVVSNSLFIANDGLAIYENDDDSTAPYNFVTYENNDFYDNVFSPSVFHNAVEGTVDVAGLNAMVVDRTGPDTDKAPFDDNVALVARPVAGKLLGVPPRILGQTAAGDAQTSTESFLAYGWHGECAELDGSPLAAATGLTSTGTGVHSLMVFDNGACSGAPDLDLTASVTQGPTPAATLSADPVMIPGGGSSTLTWDTPGGTFLESALDQGHGVLGSASGSVVVSPSLTTNYTYFAITEEGGDSAEQRVFVDEDPPDELIFADGFESGNTSAWSSTVP